jgi:hypothetical protein
MRSSTCVARSCGQIFPVSQALHDGVVLALVFRDAGWKLIVQQSPWQGLATQSRENLSGIITSGLSATRKL